MCIPLLGLALAESWLYDIAGGSHTPLAVIVHTNSAYLCVYNAYRAALSTILRSDDSTDGISIVIYLCSSVYFS